MNDKKLANLKGQAVTICGALAAINNDEFLHLMYLGRVKEDDIIIREGRGREIYIDLSKEFPVPTEWRTIFSKIGLRLSFHTADGETIRSGSIGYSYEHPGGGSNGKDIARFSVSEDLKTLTMMYTREVPNPDAKALSYAPTISIYHKEEVSL